MTYLNSLYIKKFRAINNLELTNLSRVNILVGDNNCGKTSVLEAISLFQNPDSMSNVLVNCEKRSRGTVPVFDLFLEMFPRDNEDQQVEISTIIKSVPYNLSISGKILENNEEYYEVTDNEKRIFDGNLKLVRNKELITNTDIKIYENNPTYITLDSSNNIVNIVYVASNDHLRCEMTNNIIENIKCIEKEEIINVLKAFDENIVGFEVMHHVNGKSVIYINHKKYGLMNLSSFGDGVKKVLTLSTSVVAAKNGILLIDEIETAIHKNILKDILKWFINACKIYKIQLIVTTHSLEVIDAFIEGINNIDKLACFRLEHCDDYIYTNRLKGKKLKDIRCVLGQDVR